ncbi:MAG: hypothetical protein ABSB59_35100 [Streptosporangiaceae bacterium]
MVIGEIPREPPGFTAREMVDRPADAAERGQMGVMCALTGLRGVGKTQVAAAYAREDRGGMGAGRLGGGGDI